MPERKMHPAVKSATELGPIVIFFVVFKFYDTIISIFGAPDKIIAANDPIMAATGAIMVTTLIALAVSYYYERKLPMMPLVTAVIVTIFGGLTLYFDSEIFIKLKPTIIYTLFSLALTVGLLMGKSFIQTLFGNVWDLDQGGWKKLTIRLILFFLAMALANEVIWRSFSTDIWVNAKVFGFTAATFVFFMLQVPLITRHSQKVENSQTTD